MATKSDELNERYAEHFINTQEFTSTQEFEAEIDTNSRGFLELGPDVAAGYIQLSQFNTPLSEAEFLEAFPEGRKAIVKIITTVTFEDAALPGL